MPIKIPSVAQFKCAFFAFFDAFPNQRVWVVDIGETKEERQEAIEDLWRKFESILSEVEKAG